jgi:hypothetical protein
LKSKTLKASIPRFKPGWVTLRGKYFTVPLPVKEETAPVVIIKTTWAK